VTDYDTILLERGDDGVAVLTFNRPEVRNALNQQMVDDIRHALGSLAADPELSVLILAGAGGKAFIGGADIAELRDRDAEAALRRINSELFREVERFPAPTIAAIQGFALGGGCELAMACDLRVCGEGSQLGQPEVGLGIIPGAGATYRMPKLVGLGVARELIFTGRIIDAAEALRIGLVNRVSPDDAVMPAARELATEVAKNSRLAVRLAKVSLNLSSQLSTEAGQALESASQGILFDHEEKKRRMTSFLERKKARKETPVGVTVVGGEERLFTYPDLAGLPAAQQIADVGAVVPGREGRAVRIGTLLEAVGGDAPFVAVTSSDGKFRTSLAREEMTAALLVYSLDGQPLPKGQGGPYRLLIPETLDSCANIKQVGRVELLAESTENACPHSAEDHERIRARRKG
jgi:enoyl-CoA hydratase